MSSVRNVEETKCSWVKMSWDKGTACLERNAWERNVQGTKSPIVWESGNFSI